MPDHIVALDQGTTSTRAIVFDARLTPVAMAQQECRQIFPEPGWVEHDPEDIWNTSIATVREAMAKAGLAAKDVAGIGITNQRETALIWDRDTGKPIHNAIVWQDRRTADRCAHSSRSTPLHLAVQTAARLRGCGRSFSRARNAAMSFKGSPCRLRSQRIKSY